MTRPTMLYEDEDVAVSADLRETEGVVICFSTFRKMGDPAGTGESFVQSIGLSAVTLNSKYNHWWQMPGRDWMCAAVKEATAHYAYRSTYGSSMGGYGALTLGVAAGCNRILAISPQTVISDPAVPLHRSWAKAVAQRPILRDAVVDDLQGMVPEIVFDPFDPIDVAHLDHLRGQTKVLERPFPFAGHKLLSTFRDCGVLRSITTDLVKGDGSYVVMLDRYLTARHRAPRFLRNVAAYERAQGDASAADTTLKMLTALGGDVMDGDD